MDRMSEDKGRSLRQEEIDGYYRQDFLNQVLGVIATGKTALFVVHKDHYSLVEIQRVGSSGGKYTLSVGGDCRYTYHFSKVVRLLEDIYDKGLWVISLKGETAIVCEHHKANADAEPDTEDTQ